jgi:cytochrome c-type biogenesis protein CcmH
VQEKEPSGTTGRTQSISSLAWPVTTQSPLLGQDPPAGAGVQAPPVESLVAGLEARLAEQPNDAEGWTLLAQSYAYTSNEEAVERAVRRAVDLGVDEAMLRDRISSAKRRAQPVDWVEEALRAGRSR